MTTRPPRPGEVDGVDYNFVSRDQMDMESANGTLIEHGEYKGHLYGTSANHLKTLMGAGYYCVINPHYQVNICNASVFHDKQNVFFRRSNFCEPANSNLMLCSSNLHLSLC